ncbi:MAG: Asp-tRNA(Asn)/Glu-tRNA(Gln) amidotransferase subunit GatB [Candidatus Kryptoniota bacterium]
MDWNRYEPVIGLEVHAQMLTHTKAFCGCSTEFGKSPNSNVCPICLGMPGVLPVLNKKLVEYAVKMGIATNSIIASRSIFARKNYFYPDLPKGYQISQYEEPICHDGYIEIQLKDGTRKQVGLVRIHMEEDAGKSIHDQDVDTLVDLNRCGIPLLEIVSKPDIRSPEEAYLYLQQIRQIVTYLEICDGNMEEGSLRCDANISLRLRGSEKLGTKTEIKNLNSFRNVEHALEVEIERQYSILESGEAVVQETLLYDADNNNVRPMRMKEEANDYRYFPEPDLVPVIVNEKMIQEVKRSIPEMPLQRRDRFVKGLGLPLYDSDILTSEKEVADYFEEIVHHLVTKNVETVKQASNYIMTDILRATKEKGLKIKDFPVPPAYIARMIDLINEGIISTKIAKEIFEEMVQNGSSPDDIVRIKGLRQISDEDQIEEVIDEVLSNNPSEVSKYLGGKEKLFGFFVGEVMKRLHGKANPKILNDLLKQKLQKVRESSSL